MISKNKKKFIKSLKNKKERFENKAFVVEGEKGVLEIIDSNFEILDLFVSKDFYEKNKKKIRSRFLPTQEGQRGNQEGQMVKQEGQIWLQEGRSIKQKLQEKTNVGNDLKSFQKKKIEGQTNFEILEKKELEEISNSVSNSSAVAILKTKENIYLEKEKDEFVLVLDNLNDPGNLGTILRICDWYGIRKIIASKNTVELTNPKVVASTMGSIKRVQIFYTDLEKYFEGKNDEIFGAFLNGENIYKTNFGKKGGYIVIGNESHGISEKIEKFITKKITIPRIGGAESLNAGVATGIILDNIFRE